jgi:hypothetical protein
MKYLNKESSWNFQKIYYQLEKDGCLPEEILLPGARRFRFKIDEYWWAIAYRKEIPTLWGGRTFEIEILELRPVSESEKSDDKTWIKQAAKIIMPLIFRRCLPPLLAAMTSLAPASNNFPGEVDIKTETDGSKVNTEITIDNRQSD